MASGAKTGIGTKLKKGNGASPEVFTAIAEVLTLSRSGRKIDLIDVTNMDSPSSNGLFFREFITGLADGGEIDFTANYRPDSSSQNDFNDSFDGSLQNWEIVLPDSLGTWSFAGLITAADHSFTVDKQMILTGKIKISGADSFA